jgi:hypothetical protein
MRRKQTQKKSLKRTKKKAYDPRLVQAQQWFRTLLQNKPQILQALLQAPSLVKN